MLTRQTDLFGNTIAGDISHTDMELCRLSFSLQKRECSEMTLINMVNQKDIHNILIYTVYIIFTYTN